MLRRMLRCPACAFRVLPDTEIECVAFVCTGCARRWERPTGLGLTARLERARQRR
jgi:hypothetical protein